MHGLRCYVNITRTPNVSEYTLVLALCLVMVALRNRADHNIFFCCVYVRSMKLAVHRELFSVHYMCSSYRECERLVYMKDAHLDVIKRSDAGAQLRA